MSTCVVIKYYGSNHSQFSWVRSALQKKYPQIEIKKELVMVGKDTFEVILNKDGKEILVHSLLKGDFVVDHSNGGQFMSKFDAAFKAN